MYRGPNKAEADESWHSYQFDTDENPVQALLVAVSAVTNDAPEDMEILYDVINPEALRNLFERPQTDERGLNLAFRYNGCQIVMSPGYVHVREDNES